MVCFTSESDIPNGLPKRIECRSILLLILETNTIPRAKNPVNTNPITVSSLTLDFCLINPINATEPTPKINAPNEKGDLMHKQPQHQALPNVTRHLPLMPIL